MLRFIAGAVTASFLIIGYQYFITSDDISSAAKPPLTEAANYEAFTLQLLQYAYDDLVEMTQFPIRLDNVTTWTDVGIDKDAGYLIYNHIVSSPDVAQKLKTQPDEYRKRILRSACGDRGMMFLLFSGVKMRWTYSAETGEPITTIEHEGSCASKNKT